MSTIPDEKIKKSIYSLVADNEATSIFNFDENLEEAEQLVSEQFDIVRQLEELNASLISISSDLKIPERNQKIQQINQQFDKLQAKYKKNFHHLKIIKNTVEVTYQAEKDLSEYHQFLVNQKQLNSIIKASAIQDVNLETSISKEKN
ncbi:MULTISPECIES: hypothetical protein [unclassified Enterococcus]|uniref:hypothetical protein n=1 Tax=unclassified Enterococcus TaxID=2608891 RepID=UPI0015536265|nr:MULTISPECIES: hypothetical protein [unclassified Enterococcus]MBS7576339.1 hypothetical protein [Enterococcus sp. MMGLQ5-2]MBS7583571.1 hypothetical protein [Enterococcus sp. MMGLQ5-1]NPD11433.1 hypothetical protein [Enterococcus sp. MMGLQ5-1]NPD36177.1 hypothetical protein [Enterococcus sp. MMGLQ5-2]